jgi:hypothetical protein
MAPVIILKLTTLGRTYAELGNIVLFGIVKDIFGTPNFRLNIFDYSYKILTLLSNADYVSAWIKRIVK